MIISHVFLTYQPLMTKLKIKGNYEKVVDTLPGYIYLIYD